MTFNTRTLKQRNKLRGCAMIKTNWSIETGTFHTSTNYTRAEDVSQNFKFCDTSSVWNVPVSILQFVFIIAHPRSLLRCFKVRVLNTNAKYTYYLSKIWHKIILSDFDYMHRTNNLCKLKMLAYFWPGQVLIPIIYYPKWQILGPSPSYSANNSTFQLLYVNLMSHLYTWLSHFIQRVDF